MLTVSGGKSGIRYYRLITERHIFVYFFTGKAGNNNGVRDINSRQVYGLRAYREIVCMGTGCRTRCRKSLLHCPSKLSPPMEFDPCQVYSPEADTVLLLEAARAEVMPGDRVLEVGTGSGLIAAEIAKVTQIVATDINPHAASCAHQKGIELVRTDLVSGFRGLFDLILFNPPYLPTRPEDRMNDWLEYALDGGASGRLVIEQFARAAGDILAPGGRILLLISSLTGLRDIQALFTGLGYSACIASEQVIEDEVLYVLRIIREK
jgi:release factor glutamine methyltransferase